MNIANPYAPILQAYTGTAKPPEPFPTGDYMEVKRPGTPRTNNEDCWGIWRCVNSEAQRFSAKSFCANPIVTKDLIVECIAAINRCFVDTDQRVQTRANLSFPQVYGGPMQYSYEPFPIVWTGNNTLALQIVLSFCAAAYQVPQLYSNYLPAGVWEDHATTVVLPLYARKVQIMQSYFGLEVKGDVSANELTAIFRGSNLQPPVRQSLDDIHDTATDRAAEDAMAMGNESAHIPTPETIEAAKQGVDAWSWYPTEENIATMGEKLRRIEESGPLAAPGEPFPFSTSVVQSAGGATPASGAGGVAGLTVPR